MQKEKAILKKEKNHFGGWGFILFFKINVRKRNKCPVKEITQRKKLIVWKLFRKQ